MSNPIFNALGGGMSQNPMMQQFPRFMQMMQGRNPNEMINQLISSGQVNQAQLNQVQQQAQQISGMFNQFKGMFGF